MENVFLNWRDVPASASLVEPQPPLRDSLPARIALALATRSHSKHRLLVRTQAESSCEPLEQFASEVARGCARRVHAMQGKNALRFFETGNRGFRLCE
jgi:hypothetical protein